ncbi:MAG: tyrosine-type recombinase/integrase [Faecousia sp.]
MASIKLQTAKDGTKSYKITYYRASDGARLSTTWHIPEGWSQRAIERKLQAVVAAFAADCNSGKVKSRKEIRELEKQEEERRKAEEAKMKTLRQFCEQIFMPTLEVTCSEHTRASFQGNLKNHIYPALGDINISEIAPVQISALLLSLQAQKKLKHGSVIKVFTIINLIFKKAYKSGLINRNPMDFVERPKPTKAEGKNNSVKAFTGAELAYIQTCIARETTQWQALFHLMMETGCRRGEALGLSWDNINMESGCISIEKSLCYTPEKGIYLDTPKSGKSRAVYISVNTISLLKNWQTEQTGLREKMQLSKRETNYVFTQQDGVTPMHPDTPTRYFAKLGKKYNISHFHPHKLRHSFATVAITSGADIASVSGVLGHADTAITLRMYTHADTEAQKRAQEIFRNAIG